MRRLLLRLRAGPPPDVPARSATRAARS